jgi:chemotaxis protein methyltransferase CheR
MNFKEYLLELKKHSPYDFSEYSDNSIQRRLQKVLEIHDISIDDLLKKTISDPVFVEQLINDITVNTTEFFRDPEIWHDYFEEFLPTLQNKKQIKIWHAGSSTGQEVYSNLMLLDNKGLLSKTQLYATDINQLVLNDAEKGNYRYANNIKSIESFKTALENAPTNKTTIEFNRYFSTNKQDDTLNINPLLKKIAIFRKHDLVKDNSPISDRFDLIFCRNVLIYFNITLQSKILKMFHESLVPGGMLLLGNHESLHGFFKTRFTRNGNFYVKNNAFHFKY